MTSPSDNRTLSILTNTCIVIEPSLFGAWLVKLVSDELQAVLWQFDEIEHAQEVAANVFPELEIVVKDESFQDFQDFFAEAL